MTAAGLSCGSCGTQLGATAKFCSECGTPVSHVTQFHRVASCSARRPHGWSTAQRLRPSPSSFRSKAQLNRCGPVGYWAWSNRTAIAGVVSRIWSVGAGRCPPSRACWTVQSTATAQLWAWSAHLALAKAVSYMKFRRWQPPVVSRCSRVLRVAHQSDSLPRRLAAVARDHRRRGS